MAEYSIYNSQWTAQQIEASIGKNPRIGESGNWEVWNMSTMSWDDTGVAPSGGAVIPATEKLLKGNGAGGVEAADYLISGRNLLDNPWFTVNQRGQNSYTGSGYTVDRWIADYGGTSVSASGVTLAPSVGVLHQYFEDDVWKWLGGRQVTLSIMTADGTVYSHTRSCPDYRVGVDADQMTFSNNWKYQLYSRTSELQIRIIGVGGTSDVSIRAVKLELGSVSTLANDVPPNYAEELAKCQRYFYCFNSKASNYHFADASIAYANGNVVWFAIPTPVTMRTSPSVTVVQQGAIAVRENGHSTAFNSSDSTIRADSSHPNQFSMILTPNNPPSYWTQHYVPVVAYTTGSVETIIFASADL